LTDSVVPDTASQGMQPPIPKLMYLVVNPLLKFILRSPLHGVLSDKLMVLAFNGRKSGKQFSTPVGYTRLPNGTLMLFTNSNWWKNLQSDPVIHLRLQGQERQARAEICQDTTLIAQFINQMIEGRGVKMSDRMGLVHIPTQADPEEVRRLTKGKTFISITLK